MSSSDCDLCIPSTITAFCKFLLVCTNNSKEWLHISIITTNNLWNIFIRQFLNLWEKNTRGSIIRCSGVSASYTAMWHPIHESVAPLYETTKCIWNQKFSLDIHFWWMKNPTKTKNAMVRHVKICYICKMFCQWNRLVLTQTSNTSNHLRQTMMWQTCPQCRRFIERFPFHSLTHSYEFNNYWYIVYQIFSDNYTNLN